MKQWMIWTAAAILGIGLAAILIPWVGVGASSVEPLPEVELPDPSEGVARDTPRRSDSPKTPVQDFEPPEDIGTVPTASGTDDDADDDAEPADNFYRHPAREARAERLSQPDVVAVRIMGSRWRGVMRLVNDREHDPAGDHTVNRIEVLQKDLRAYRRNPDEYDFDEILARQDNIIGELRQTSYWDDRLERLTESVKMAERNYESEMRQGGE